MTFRKLIFALALPVLIVACGEKKKHVGDVEFRDSLVYVDDKPYSGDVWSNDEHLYRITTQDGVVVNCQIYHANDSVAIEILNDSTVNYFTEQGDTLPEDSFKVRYKDMGATLKELVDILRK